MARRRYREEQQRQKRMCIVSFYLYVCICLCFIVCVSVSLCLSATPDQIHSGFKAEVCLKGTANSVSSTCKQLSVGTLILVIFNISK